MGGDTRMRVLGLHADATGCGYYRIALPLSALAARGHDVSLSGVWVDQPDYDIVVGQRVGDAGEFDRWRQLSEQCALVYEIDDDLFHIEPTNLRAYPQLSDPAVRRGMARSLAYADLVTVSTSHLAEVVGALNPNVAVLPNHVDAALLDHRRPRRHKVTVGWSGGDSHLADMRVAADPLQHLLRDHPQVDVHLMGADYRRLIGGGRHTPFRRDIWPFYRGIDFDVGVAPLADTTFNRSKSHIRALEYAALGIPVVASDVPAYADMVIDGVTGFLVSSEQEWEQRLAELIADEGLREQMGVKAREHAAGWTITEGAALWEQAYQRLL